MKYLKLVVCFGTFALALASAASSYTVTLLHPCLVGEMELKPGDYKVTVDGDKATIKAGKQMAEAVVKVQSGASKFSKTTIHYNNGDGKYRVSEILLGGTTSTLVFDTKPGLAVN